MSSVNKAIILGNLGRDPEIRSMTNGDRVANLSVATSENWKDKNSGERRERTEWHRITIFNPHLVDVAERYLEKGDKVYLEGAIQTRKWQDQDGQERYSTEIVLQKFDGKLVLLAGGGASDEGDAGDEPETPRRPVGGQSDLDDDIPFS